jgi:hypothetical protein
LLGFTDPVFENARSGNIVPLIAKDKRLAHQADQRRGKEAQLSLPAQMIRQVR